MSELRVNNIVSEDGSAAPIYSRGMNIGAGTTLTCDGNFVVGGATSIAGTVDVGGLLKANTLTPLTGNTVTISSGKFLSVGGGVTVTSGGSLEVSGSASVGGAATITGSVDVQGTLKANTLTPRTGDTVTISSGKFLAVGGGVTVTNGGSFTVSGPTSFQSGAIVTGVVTFTEADLQASLTLDGLDVGSNIKLGNAGVITATSFSGDGSNLTGIDATTIVNGTSNVTVAASGDITATRAGTTRLTVTGSGIDVNGTVACDGMTVDGTAQIQSTIGQVQIKDTNSSGSSSECLIRAKDSTDTNLWYYGTGGGVEDLYVWNYRAGAMQFATNNTLRAQFTSTGHFVPGANNSYDLGTSSTQWRNAHFDGTVQTDTLRIDGSSSGYTSFNAAASSGNLTLTWPAAYGSDNSVLQTDSAGNLSWVNPRTSTLIYSRSEDGSTGNITMSQSIFNFSELIFQASNWRNIYMIPVDIFSASTSSSTHMFAAYDTYHSYAYYVNSTTINLVGGTGHTAYKVWGRK